MPTGAPRREESWPRPNARLIGSIRGLAEPLKSSCDSLRSGPLTTLSYGTGAMPAHAVERFVERRAR
jgi:hypothetical protein